MATINIELPETLYTRLQDILDRTEQAARSAQLSLEMSSRLVSEGGTAYTTLSDEIKQLRELVSDMRERLHTLGNAINGKLGAYEAEIIIQQVVEERLKYHNLI